VANAKEDFAFGIPPDLKKKVVRLSLCHVYIKNSKSKIIKIYKMTYLKVSI